MDTIIYAVKNKISGSMYIGSTTNWKERKRCHIKTLRGQLKSPTRLYEAGRKYQLEDFEFLIIEEGFNPDEIFIKEEYWILHFDTINKGYNISLPSESKNTYKGLVERINSGLYRVPTTLKAISPEEWVKKRKENPQFLTKDLRIKNTRHLSYKKIFELNEKFEVISTIESITDLQKNLTINLSYIEKALRINGSKPYKLRKLKNRLFIKEEDYELPLVSVKVKIKKEKEKLIKEPIIKTKELSLINGLEIRHFTSRVEAADFLKVSPSKINELITGFRNKGNNKIVPFTHIKNWKLYLLE